MATIIWRCSTVGCGFRAPRRRRDAERHGSEGPPRARDRSMLRTMPVAVLAPFAFPAVRGNAVTVQRIVAGLRARDVAVSLWDVSATSEAAVAAEVERSRPVLIHAFHALRAGMLALRLARRLEVPLVVTLTGTDANHELLDAVNAPQEIGR